MFELSQLYTTAKEILSETSYLKSQDDSQIVEKSLRINDNEVIKATKTSDKYYTATIKYVITWVT